jgi:hypothetical protein
MQKTAGWTVGVDYSNQVHFYYRGDPTTDSDFQGIESEFRLDSGRFAIGLDLLDVE